ncbi:MAG: S41 family peptidase [Saprospiraceae bacterium]|nr:S41 family peptidase [Saprospiraceae bacterium]
MNLLKFVLIAAMALSVSGFFPAAAQQPAETLSGEWSITLRHRGFGEFRLLLDVETLPDGTFAAYSHRKGVKNLMGGFKAAAGKIFGPKSNQMIQTGALCRIENGAYTTDAEGIAFSGVLHTPMAKMDVKGRVSNGKISAAVFQTNTGKALGGLEGARRNTAGPADDYSLINSALMSVYDQKIYDRRVLQSKEWKKFARQMERFAARAQDDLDMMAAFYTYSNPLPFSHKGLYRVEGVTGMGATPFVTRPGQLSLEEKTPETVVLRVRSFSCTAQEMDSLLQIVVTKGYQNLIVDLRGNPGGSLEGGMTLAGYLTDRETPTGVYLTQRWFNDHPAPPTAAELETMPAFSKADVAAFTEALEQQGFVVLKARPGTQRFDGRLFILTDRKSASACEPLTWNLQHTGRATVVGEATAGQMLSAESYPVHNGFMAVIPNADYYTPTGERLDFVGVQPNIPVKSEQALAYVLGMLAEKK